MLTDPRIAWRPVVRYFKIVPDVVNCFPASPCGPGVVAVGEPWVWGDLPGSFLVPGSRGEAAVLGASVAQSRRS